MKLTQQRFRSAVALIIFAGMCSFASAQATRTWVSGVGDDANPCSRTAPCKTFAGAISKTATGGEINCIDPGGFGAVTITKAITIDGGGTFASILASFTNGVVVNAGVNDRVVLRNLSINGAATGLDGIRFLAGAELNVENCKIHRFSGDGIEVNKASGIANLTVRETGIFRCNGAGIKINTTADTVFSSIDHVTINTCFNGIQAVNGARIAMRGCDLTLCTNGVVVQSGALASRADVDTCQFLYHTNALQCGPGASSVIRLMNNTINNNTTALLGSGGTFFTAGNNNLMGNTSDGVVPTLIPPQ